MSIQEALQIAAVFRAGQKAPPSMEPAHAGGPVDVAMTAIGIGYRERATAVLAEHVGSDEIYTALEQLAGELGIPLKALRPGEEHDPTR